MLKRVLSLAVLLCVGVFASNAAPVLKAYIKSFQTSNNCTYQTFNFRDSSSYTGGSHKSANRDKWYYSDNTTDTGASVFKTFATTGSFTVSLVVTNKTDNLKDSTSKTFTIVNIGIKPSFTIAGNACQRVELDVTNTSTSSDANNKTADSVKGTSPYTSYAFVWGDGSANGSAEPNTVPGYAAAVKVYQNTGTYTITLKDSSKDGCKSSTSQNITIAGTPFPRTPNYIPHCQDSSVFFKVTQLSAADTQGFHVTYSWKFPDNTTKTGPSVSKLYNDSGSFQLILTLVNHVNASCSGTEPFNFTVPSKPKVAFTYVPTCDDSIGILFDASTDPYGQGNDSWHWSFCDSNKSNCDTAAGYTGPYVPAQFTYGFPYGGKFYVTETVKTIDGCVNSDTEVVYIYPSPTANFLVKNTCADTAVAFTDLSTVTGTDSNKIIGWAWDFGDPVSGASNVSHLQNPTHKYSEAGYNYKATLTVSTQHGCQGVITKKLNVWPLPATSFSAPSRCQGIPVPFSNSSVMPLTAVNDNVVRYYWNFADGATDTLATPLHTFNSSGTFNVKMSAFSSHGCADTVIYPLFIYPLPKPSFHLQGNCERDSGQFINTTTDAFGKLKDSSYSWDFGDTAVANYVINPKHLYHYFATFKVKLSVVDSLGCAADTIIPVVIIPGPHSGFTTGPKCTGQPVQFTNTTYTQASGTIDYKWRFGDGDTSIVANPTHTYPGSSNYRARLISYMPSTGCIDSTPLQQVAVTPVPVAYFKTANNCADSTIRIKDSSYVPGYGIGYIDSVSYNFGDGQKGKGLTATHQYATNGQYTITEYATSTSGCLDSVSKPISIFKVPHANFGYTLSCAGTPTPFFDSSKVADSVVAWRWLFSNLDSSKIQNPTHIFNNNDPLVASMTVYTANGCPVSKSQSINIELSPIADFNENIGCDQKVTTFYGGNNSNVLISTYSWDFDDSLNPGDNTSAQQNPDHTYASAGNYQVSLIEKSTQGCYDTFKTQITIPWLPIPGFTFTGSCFGQPFTFVDTSQHESLFGAWDMGDGTFPTGRSFTHTFAKPGTYIVKMSAQNGIGCNSDSVTKVVVVNALPIAKFTTDTVCFGNATKISDSSVSNGGTITQYAWNYGDGTSDSTKPNPYFFHTFGDTIRTNADTFYNVHLFVATNFGCDSNITEQVKIRQKPYASFIANPEPADIQYPTINFTNTTKFANAKDYYWTFGDGTDGHDVNPSHTYKDTGSYLVTLAADNSVCFDTFKYTVYVVPGYSIFAPNCITANGDNLNDGWLAKGVGVLDFDVTIVDRWGQVVFHSNDINQPWNADYNGNGVKVPEGVYKYSIKASNYAETDFKSLTGHITVLR